MEGGERQAGTPRCSLEGAEKVSNHQKKLPLLHRGLKRALKPQRGPVHPRYRWPCPSSLLGLQGMLFARSKKMSPRPLSLTAAGKGRAPHSGAFPGGLPGPAHVPGTGMGSCWLPAWQHCPRERGAHATLVPIPLSQERLPPPPGSPRAQNQNGATPTPCAREEAGGGSGLWRCQGPPLGKDLAPEASAVPGKNIKHISERLESCRLPVQGQGMEEQADTGLPRSGGAKRDGRAVRAHVLCHPMPVSPTPKVQGGMSRGRGSSSWEWEMQPVAPPEGGPCHGSPAMVQP